MTEESVSKLTPSQRQKLLAKRRREREAAEAQRIEEGKNRGAKQRLAFDLEQVRLRESLIQRCHDDKLVPVRLGNLSGPEGNVFNVIGSVQNGIKWAEDAGLDIAPEVRLIVSDYMNRSYEQTLDMIEAYCLDLEGSIFNLRQQMSEKDGGSPIPWGDNPLGAILRR